MRALYRCYGGAIQALDKAMRGVGGSYKPSISALDERSEGAIRALLKRFTGAMTEPYKCYESATRVL